MILIIVEHAHGAPRKSAFELVSVGRALSDQNGMPLAALVLARASGAIADELAGFVPQVYSLSDARLDPPRADTVTRAVAHAVSMLGVSVVLVPGSRAGLAYGPRVAYRIGGAYLENVTRLALDGETLVAQRPTHLSRFTTTVAVRGAPTVASISLASAPPAAPREERGSVVALDVPFEAVDDRLEVSPRQSVARRRVALEDAEVVVCGGRGLGSSEAFERHAVGLADRLGAGVGVTRAVVDAGWRSFDELIGQTGRTIAPKLCVTLGASGAPHFMSGMNRAGVIVAVNKDAEAPIFKASDYGIVGDVAEVVPAIEEVLAEP